MERKPFKKVPRLKRPKLWIFIGVAAVVLLVALCSHGLDFCYPLVNWEKAETVSASFALKEFPEASSYVELSADAAAELMEILQNGKYKRRSYFLRSVVLDERRQDLHWTVYVQFENGTKMSLEYSERGGLVISRQRSGFFPEGAAVNRGNRLYAVEGAELFTAEILDVIMGEFEAEREGSDLSACTVRDAYPGLYFLEVPTFAGGVEVTAYQLTDGEPVLVGGYVDHRSVGFDVLLHADGKVEAVWPDRDVETAFEELLETACRKMDPYKATSEETEDKAIANYANEIMAAIGGFVEERRAVPQGYLRCLTEEQRAMAEEYNGQTLKVRQAVAEAAIQAVSVVKGTETWPYDYYDYEDADYRMIGKLIDVLVFSDYKKRIEENGVLYDYLSAYPDSFSRLDSALAERLAALSEYNGITVESYCELADRFCCSLEQSGAVPVTDDAMAVAVLVMGREAVPEELRSKLDGDIAELVTQYNEQTAELKEFYYREADLRCRVLFYEKDRVNQRWYREQFPLRLATYVLYENYTELVWSDPFVAQPASVEYGGSYGLWAYYLPLEEPQYETAQRIVDYLDLVEDLLTGLNRAG